MTAIYHAVLYQGADGVPFQGPRCSSRDCAIDTVKPLDGTTVLGLVELDEEPGTALSFWKRHRGQRNSLGATITFDHARMPPRDADGWALHPDVDLVLEERDDDEDQALDMGKLAAAGFEARFVSFEDDADDEVQDAYYKRDEGTSLWKPTVPEGNGWQLVGVYDTECSPYAMFVRRVAP